MNTTKQDQERISRMQENLAAIRRIAGWTAQRLADEIGVSRQTITNLERGSTPMSKTQYLAIRMVLNFEIAEQDNDALALTIRRYVDEPAEKIKDSAQNIASSAGRTKSADHSTSTMQGLSMLTTALLSFPIKAGIAGAAIAEVVAGKDFKKLAADAARKNDNERKSNENHPSRPSR